YLDRDHRGKEEITEITCSEMRGEKGTILPFSFFRLVFIHSRLNTLARFTGVREFHLLYFP
ncbi:MAG: hypothetical protein JSV83_18495, partial [Desulfobacterales bacterium]